MADIHRDVDAMLRTYQAQVPALDAFWQWAHNTTSKSAGFAWKENYKCITANLVERYGISQSAAEEVTEQIAATMNSFANRYETYDLQSELANLLSGKLGGPIRTWQQTWLSKADTAVRLVVAVLSQFVREAGRGKELWPDDLTAIRAIALTLWATSGLEPLTQEAMRRSLLEGGFINRSYYISTLQNSRYTNTLGVLPSCGVADFVGQDKAPEASRYVARLFANGEYEALRLLEQMLRQSQEDGIARIGTG